MSSNDHFWRSSAPRAWAPADWNVGTLHPRADMHEEVDKIEVMVELPGVDERNIQLVLDNNILTIWGAMAPRRHEREGSFHIMERAAGAFRRSIPIPVKINEDAVNASFKNGLLTITLPKAESTEPSGKRIPISSP